AAATTPAARPPSHPELDRIANEYVDLVLALGEHEPDYVDAYIGPAERRARVPAEKLPLAEIETRAPQLAAQALAIQPANQRARFLGAQLEALAARAHIDTGVRLSFDDEARALYDAVAPHITEEELRPSIRSLDELLPGNGSVPERLESYYKRFEIPAA